MFRSASSRLSSVVLAAGLLGFAAPLMAAGPEVKIEARGGGWTMSPGFGKLKVRWGSPQRRIEPRRPEHVMPCDLELSAFQSGNTVIVVARGTNRESGYVTRFEACDLNDRSPEVHLINIRGHGACGQMITPFEVTGSFQACRPLSCIKVHVGNRCHDVRVVQAPCL